MECSWLTVWRAEIWDRASDAFHVGATVNGSASADAHVGQLTFLYVTRPVGGIVAVLSVTRPPRVPDTEVAAAYPWAKTIVDYTVHAVFDPPLSIVELRADATLGASYPVRRNMNLTVAALDEEETAALVRICAARQPGLLEALEAIATPEPPLAFTSEVELEQWLVDHLHRLSEIDGTNYRLAEPTVDGIAGRQPTLPTSDTRPDLILVDDRGEDGHQFVIVEVKNSAARPEHVGQLAHYVSWVRQHLPGAADARGLLVTTANTLAASTAVQVVPAVSQLSLADITDASALEPIDMDEFEFTDLLRGASNVLANRLTCLTTMLESRSYATRDGEPDVLRIWDGLFDDLDRLGMLIDELVSPEQGDAETPG